MGTKGLDLLNLFNFINVPQIQSYDRMKSEDKVGIIYHLSAQTWNVVVMSGVMVNVSPFSSVLTGFTKSRVDAVTLSSSK